MYINDEADQLTSLTRGTISATRLPSPTYQEDFSPNGNGNIAAIPKASRHDEVDQTGPRTRPTRSPR